MKRNNIDDKIKEMLLKETEFDEHLKEVTWEKINEELHRQTKEKKSPKGKKWFISFAVAAAMMLIVLSTMTETGRAMIQNIKDTFVPNKQIELEIEGQKEPSDVELKINEQLDYVIYIDEDRYRMEAADSVDRIVPNEALGDNYPEVYMEISESSSNEKDKIIEEIERRINEDGLAMLHREEVSQPVDATMIYALQSEYVLDGEVIDLEWDAIVHRYYVINTDKEQSFVIKQQFFTEAEEGHGARFDAMLESFEVLPTSED